MVEIDQNKSKLVKICLKRQNSDVCILSFSIFLATFFMKNGSKSILLKILPPPPGFGFGLVPNCGLQGNYRVAFSKNKFPGMEYKKGFFSKKSVKWIKNRLCKIWLGLVPNCGIQGNYRVVFSKKVP